MLVTREEISFVEGFAHVGAGIEIGLALGGYPSPWGSMEDAATTISAPLERVPVGRPQSGGSDAHQSTVTR